MPHSRPNPTTECLERLLGNVFFRMSRLPYPLLLLTLVLMPLIYDDGQAWWLPLNAIILTIILVLYAIPIWWHGRLLPKPTFSPVLLLFILPLACSLFQIIPSLPAMDLIAPTVAGIWRNFNQIAVIPATPTLSLAPDATTERAITFAICTVFCFLLTNETRTPDQLKGLLLAITCAALGNALLAYVEMGSVASSQQATSVSGAFMNRNHFAFLMMLGTMTALGLLTIVTGHSHRDECNLNRGLWERLALPLILVIFILLTAQVVSLSRGAFLASTIAFAIFALLWLLSPDDQKHRQKRQLLMAYATLLALALAFALFFSLEKLSDRYKDLTKQDFTMDDRWMIWKDTTRLIRDAWQTGVGQGAFPHAIQPYESGHFTDHLLGHAHNDFLEFIAETGVPMAIAMGVITLILMLVAFRRAWKNTQSRTQRWAACAALVAIIGAFVHECFDFNLQAWANMLVFTALAATAASATKNPRGDEPVQQQSMTRHRRKRLTVRLPWLILAMAALAILPLEIRYLKAGMARANLMQDLERGASSGKPARMDFDRRMGLIAAGRHPLLSDHYAHKQQAIILATYAEQKPMQAPQLMKQAAHHTALAATRLPTDGNTAFLNATFHRHASTLGDSTLRHNQLEELYDWTIACQPHIASTLETIGMVTFQNFLDAHGQENQSIIRHARNRARSILLKCLRLNPDNKKIYDALFYLFGTIPELLKATPENYDAMITLAHMLIHKKQPRETLNLTQHILARAKKLNLNDKQIIETLSMTAAAQEILGLEKQRNGTWTKLWKTVRHASYMTNADEHRNAPPSPKQLIDDCEREAAKRFLTTDEIISMAKAYSLLGRQTDAVIALMRLVYHYFAPPAITQLNQALELIGNPSAISNPFFITRASFLKQALIVIRAEQMNQPQGLNEAIRLLETLRQQQEATQVPWLNQHLIPIFIARAQLVLGHPQQAVRSLRQALAICPYNIIAMRLMQRTDHRALLNSERKILQLMNARTYPIALFKSGLAWITTNFSEDIIQESHQQQHVTYLFFCWQDILQPIRLTMTYQDQEGTAFTDEITFENGREMTFKIGEIVAVRHSWQPVVNTLQHATRLLTDGQLVIRADGIALPMPITQAFKVRLKDRMRDAQDRHSAKDLK